MALPPGPRSRLLATLRFLHDPYGSALRAHARHGDTYTVRGPLGTLVVTCDPEGVREILSADPDAFAPPGVELLGPILGESSLILLGGERHRAARKLLAPPFHGARVRAYGETMRAIARAEVERWPDDRPFELLARTQAISLRILVATVFGVTAPERAARLEPLLVELMNALHPSLMFMPRLRSRLWPPWVRFQRLSAAVEALVLAEIGERRAREPGDDLLGLLLAARDADGAPLAEREVFEQLMTLLVAGHETTAIALAWACQLIAGHPDVLARLVDEVRAAGAEPERLPYLEAVCLETLRLQPLAPTIARLLRRPFELRGHALPAGVLVGVSVVAVHRRPELYPEPERFQPERFLGRSFAPHELLPFGGGARRCLGAAFALHEMKLVLATILSERSLGGAAPPRVRARNTVVGPRGGVWLTATPAGSAPRA